MSNQETQGERTLKYVIKRLREALSEGVESGSEMFEHSVDGKAWQLSMNWIMKETSNDNNK